MEFERRKALFQRQEKTETQDHQSNYFVFLHDSFKRLTRDGLAERHKMVGKTREREREASFRRESEEDSGAEAPSNFFFPDLDNW